MEEEIWVTIHFTLNHSLGVYFTVYIEDYSLAGRDSYPLSFSHISLYIGFLITNHNAVAKVIIPLIMINALSEDK